MDELVGAGLFAQQLAEVGYAVQTPAEDLVIIDYEVPVGRFAGQKLKMGFVVPADFPLSPPHGPHINEHIHTVGRGGGHPTGGIHHSGGFHPYFDSSWQHWSRPPQGWRADGRGAVDYMSFIHSLWASQ